MLLSYYSYSNRRTCNYIRFIKFRKLFCFKKRPRINRYHQLSFGTQVMRTTISGLIGLGLMLFASAESNGGKQPSLNSGRALSALSVEFKDTETLQEVNIIQIHKYTQYSNFHIRKLFCSN